MQGMIRFRIGLLAFVGATALVLTGARGADDLRPREDSGRSGVTRAKTAAPVVSTDESVRWSPRYFPLAPNTQFTRKVVVLGGDADSAAAVGGDKLVYSNVNGKFVFVLPRNSTITDDLTLTAKSGCALRRFTFEVVGKADPTGLGGPYTVNWVLFDTCPAAGGLVIDGSLGEEAFPDDGPRTIEVILPKGVELPSSTIWLGVRVNRSNAGVVVGTPPSWGFSGDILDFPLATCSGNLGGFPQQPHASFNAEVFVDDSCQDAYVAYRNLNPGRGGENEGRNVRMADDLELNVAGCDLCGYEVGLRGQAVWSLDVRRDNGGVPGTVIEGTERLFFTQSDNAQIGHVLIDPPISLGTTRVWMTVSPNARTGKWILVGRDASVGRTAVTFAVLDGDTGQWDVRFPDRPDEHGGFYVTLFCAGQPPLGACCDMFILDEEGEAVCRDVPEMNCAYPARGSALLPSWNPGGACRVCEGGCNGGGRCGDDNDCSGSADGVCFQNTCIGGCRTGLECFDDTDCPGTDNGENGVCVDNSPFNHACGTSACCKPDGFCDNLTQNECNAVPPEAPPGRINRQWQRGRFCGEGLFQRCPLIACLGQEGECTVERQRFCNGGCIPGDGAACRFDSQCRGECFLNVCQGGCRPGASCLSAAQCNDDGVCVFVAADTPECIGGARDGEFCDPDGIDVCRESYCEKFVGCEDVDCCTDVCLFSPGFPLQTDFCCTTEWDEQCAELARDQVLDLCPTLLPENDECAPTDRIQGASLLDAVGDEKVGGGTARPKTFPGSSTDPGFCCHNGFEQICVEGDFADDACKTNEDCEPGGTCRIRTPRPGEKALATHWYRFNVPERGEGEPEFVSIQLDTCSSPGDTSKLDSLIEVFSIADSDLGKCQDIGRCTDGSFCRVTNDDCADGSRCLKRDEACSVSAQDCPVSAACSFDLEAACNRTTSLGIIGCNDDASDSCGHPSRDKLSRLCLEDLKRGETYIILVASKDEDTIGELRLRLTPVLSCDNGGDAVANDYCRRALPLPFHPTFEIVVPFDLAEATWDCEPADQTCLQMQTDVWYEYRPDFSGEATFEVCGPDNESTPDTCVAIYDGCDCPPVVGPVLDCGCLNLGDPECILGALETIDVVGGQCYKVRVSGTRNEQGAADLNIRFQVNDCDNNSIPDNCELSCGETDGPCDMTGCGTSEDCNGNAIPDVCDILIADGGLCDPTQRDDCSTDADTSGRPDECPNCPVGVIEWQNPPDGVIAAGYPFDPASCEATGINTIEVLAPTGADDVCWRLCETDNTGTINFISNVTEVAGTYTIELDRPITPGARTSIRYLNNDGGVAIGRFVAHPGDVNADGTADMRDLAVMIDILRGRFEP
ncbi:MAG: hypothetical protein IIC01_06935, partial [Planctomycetes bacterium]|nr:hypothetical protein [Planctomycetota bacterium]